MIRVWHYWVVRPKALFFVSQAALLGACVLLRFRHTVPGLFLLLLAFQTFLFLNGFDELIAEPNSRLFLRALMRSLAATVFVSGLVYYLSPPLSPGRTAAVSILVLSIFLLLALRFCLQMLVRRKRMVETLLIVGTGGLARKFYDEVTRGRKRAPRREEVDAQKLSAVELPGETGLNLHSSELREWIEQHGIRRIVVVEPDATRTEELAAALMDCKLRGLQIQQAADSYERLSGKLWLEALHPDWLIYSDGFRPARSYLWLKSAMDRIGALLLIVLASPLLALVAAAIRLDSRGPVLFRQLRVGQYGRNFVLYKFRSMRVDAEAGVGPKWAADEDIRVTRIGKWLRKFRLDELPQVFNVLRGDMSMIGPRPERPYFVNLLRGQIRFYGLRSYVRPGITGWAQVYYPYGASIEDAYEKLQYDLYYAKHMSFVLDVKIVIGTLGVILFGRGR